MKKILLLAVAMLSLSLSQAQTVAITFDSVAATTVTVSFAPSEGVSAYTYMISEVGGLESWLPMMGSLEACVSAWGVRAEGPSTYTFDDQVPGSQVVIYCVVEPGNALVTDTTTMATLGGTGVAEIALNVTDVCDTRVTTICTPNDEVASYKNMLITQEAFAAYGEDTVVAWLKADDYTFYEVYVWTWFGLDMGTPYYLLAMGKNANGEWGPLCRKPFTTSLNGIENGREAAVEAFPNPTTNRMVLRNLPEHARVELIDANGRNLGQVTGGVVDLSRCAKGLYMLRISNGSECQVLKVMKN